MTPPPSTELPPPPVSTQSPRSLTPAPSTTPPPPPVSTQSPRSITPPPSTPPPPPPVSTQSPPSITSPPSTQPAASIDINQYREDGMNGTQSSALTIDDDEAADEVEEALVHAMPKSKTKAERLAAVGKTAGNQGRFVKGGEIAEHLDSHRYRYDDIRKMTRGKVRALDSFWYDLRAEFWAKFGMKQVRDEWRGPEKDGPKGEFILAVNRHLKSWYSYRHLQNNRARATNEFMHMMRGLRKPTGPPRRLSAAQMYLSENVERVNEIFDAKGMVPHAEAIALRVSIAQELLDQEPEDVQTKWKAEAEQKWQELLGDYKEAKKGAPSRDPVVQKQARGNLAACLVPFWKVLEDYTGLRNYTLIAGNPPDPNDENAKFEVAVVNHGKTKELSARNFYAFDPDTFETQVMPAYTAFLAATQEGWRPTDTPQPRHVTFHDTEASIREEEEAAAEAEAAKADAARGHHPSNQNGGHAPSGSKTSSAPRAKSSMIPPPKAGPELRELLSRMSIADCRKEVARLSLIDDDDELEWTRENNVARNKLTMITLGLDAPLLPPGPGRAPRAAAEKRPNDADEYVASDHINAPSSPRATRSRTAAAASLPSQPSTASSPTPNAVSSAHSDEPTPIPAVDEDTTGLEEPEAAPTAPACDTVEGSNNAVMRKSQNNGPETNEPETNEPETNEPETNEPETSESEANEPETNEPTTNEPETNEPTTTEPATTEPATTEPATNELATNEPATNEPATNEPAVGSLDVSALPQGGRWIPVIYAMFMKEEVVPEMQATWRELLRDWVQLERALGFGYSSRGLPTPGRPKEVTWWVARGRKPRFQVDAEDRPSYADRFIQWWSACNPPWRERDPDGHPVPGGAGDWASMLKPGANGICTVIACLVGLSIAADVKTWTRSVRDVHWVVRQLLVAAAAQPQTPPHAPGTEAEAGRARGQKRKAAPEAAKKASKRSRR
ncbi:hypothetical protein PsYK624_165090 [Phanerochaete sordida]|uniref:Uncharacterized protein n=1 Tax=Phanerochaete sordida TaxID=48140 RepID=A0A9P3LLY0_9APHY|nr:hypothetical protein PsYK624_165090 [Phanerochaete sordida]